jgi:hypothetical protein
MIDSIFKVLDIFDNKIKQDYLRVALIESIRRDLQFNETLIRDIIRLKKRKKNPIANNFVLLSELKTDSIDEFLKFGIPISIVFKEQIKVCDFENNEYSYYIKKLVKDLEYEWEFIEKAFTRLLIAKNISSKRVEKNLSNINYLSELTLISLRMVKKQINYEKD